MAEVLTYSIPIRGGAQQVLIFDRFIEPVPDEL